jgi:hypothetical protein
LRPAVRGRPGGAHPDSARAGVLRDAPRVGRAARCGGHLSAVSDGDPRADKCHGTDPDEWCRPLDRSPRYEARIDGKRVAIDRVWTARSLRRVSRAEFEFRIGPLRRWARHNPGAPEATPQRPVDLDAIPPLF